MAKGKSVASKAAPYHYTECGLDNIYLTGGVMAYETPYGEGIRVCNLDDLHMAIAKTLIEQETLLDGAELRFLRKEIGLSQAELGERMGISDQAVALYEKGRRRMPKTVDVLARALYLEHINEDPEIDQMLQRIIAKHRDDEELFPAFRYWRGEWRSQTISAAC